MSHRPVPSLPRLPSAGSLYTYNSRGLGPLGGLLTGWMMIFAYAVYVPAGICVTSAYVAVLLQDSVDVSYGGLRVIGFLAGAGGLSIVLLYLAVNLVVIRVFRTEFRSQFVLWRHLLIPATAAVLLLFPLWGALHPRGSALADRLPFAAFGWLALGIVGALLLRGRRPGVSKPSAECSCRLNGDRR